MIFILIGYMWLFIHRPFEVWPWLGAYHIERVYIIAVIVYWAVAAEKRWLSCRSNLPVFLLAATFLLASAISPFAGFAYVEDWFKILVFYVLLITSIRTERDLKILVAAFVCITALYELHSLREFICGRYKYEMGTKRMVGVDATLSHPNSFGASVVYVLPFLYPAWILAVKTWQKLAIIGIFALGVACVMLTGSRSSFVGLAAVVLGGIWLSPYRWRVLPALALAAPLIFMSLRPDLQNRYLSMIDPSKGVGFAQKSVEFRENSFWDGLKSFAENPLSGAGLGSYRAKTGLATHNVYNEAMGEMGILGLLVLVGFAWAFGRDFLEARRLYEGKGDRSNLCAAPEGPFRQIGPVPFSATDETFLYSVCVAALGTCLLLFLLGYGQHNLTRYNWLWCGAFTGAAVHFLRQRYWESAWTFADDSLLDAPLSQANA
jgi:O-antigen ligase